MDLVFSNQHISGSYEEFVCYLQGFALQVNLPSIMTHSQYIDLISHKDLDYLFIGQCAETGSLCEASHGPHRPWTTGV